MTNCNGNSCEVSAPPAAKSAGGTRQPRFDVAHTEGTYFVYVELPGVSSKDVSVMERDGILAVEAPMTERSPDGWQAAHRERLLTNYELRLKLSRDLVGGTVTADHANGLLTLKIEKNESAKSKKIPVSVAN